MGNATLFADSQGFDCEVMFTQKAYDTARDLEKGKCLQVVQIGQMLGLEPDFPPPYASDSPVALSKGASLSFSFTKS